MDYIILSLKAKRAFTLPEQEQIKKRINELLALEYVDDSTIYWDEDGDILFHPPVNKRDKNYWINVVNDYIKKDNWELDICSLR